MTESSRPARLRAALKKWFKDQAKVEVVAPVMVAVGLLAYVMSVAVAPRSATELWNVIQHDFVIILVLTFPYLAARAGVWRLLLRQLGFEIPWRQLLAAFAAGEMTKSIPAGVYTQNFVLGRLHHFSKVSAIRSTTATTAMLGLETFVALPIVLILGVPGVPWLRLTLVAVVGAWLVLLVIAWILTHYLEYHLNPRRHPWLQRGSYFAAEFLEAGAELFGRDTALSLLPTILYMVVYVVDLDLIIHALGVTTVGFLHVLVVYAVTVLAVVLVPIPTEIGITEFTGLSVLEAYGVASSTAAVAMLSLRLLATGLTIAVAGVLLFLMRDELRQARNGAEHTAGGTVTASQ